MLCESFGEMRLDEIEKTDAYAYLDACAVAVGPDGAPRPRPAKGNKEIALAHTVLEYGVRVRLLKANPFKDVERLITARQARRVSDAELALAVEVGRRMGGPQHICALGLKTAFLSVRRSVEVRDLKPDQREASARPGCEGCPDRMECRVARDDRRGTGDQALQRPRQLARLRQLERPEVHEGRLEGDAREAHGLVSGRGAAAACRLRALQLAGMPADGRLDEDGAGRLGHGRRNAALERADGPAGQVYDRRRVRVAKPAR
jgi:hypothetical protein